MMQRMVNENIGAFREAYDAKFNNQCRMLKESIDVLGSKIEKVSDKLIELISFNNYNSNRA